MTSAEEPRPAGEPRKTRRKAPSPTPVAKDAPAPSPPRTLPPWRVVLHNDAVNTIDFVIETVMLLTPLKELQARQHTLEAHHTGRSLLLITHQERAEFYRDQFASRNLTVTIEPAA